MSQGNHPDHPPIEGGYRGVAAKPRSISDDLPLGLYRLYWNVGGGSSLAAVGQLDDGRRWYAPVNWTSAGVRGIACEDWRHVKRVERIA